MAATHSTSKISPQWIRQTRAYFLQFLHVIDFPPVERHGQRGQTVEPMQGVVKDIFTLERCWMRGHRNNRWLLAAVRVAVQWHQTQAFTAQRSRWEIKPEVLGL
jgi:hypothetical protein